MDMENTNQEKTNSELPRILQFLQSFIEGFSKIAKPLYRLTEKDLKCEFGMDYHNAFKQLIDKWTNAPVLTQYKLKKPITMERDASKYVTAPIFSQTRENRILRLIAYRSKSVRKSECNHDVPNKELLAIILALEN